MDYTYLITKLPNTLIKLNICEYMYNNIPLSLITKFSNLQELELSLNPNKGFINFEELSYVSFTKLQILKFRYIQPNSRSLIRFIKNNGKNLKELCLIHKGGTSGTLNLAVSKFCTNLRKLSIGCKNDEFQTLKLILKSCTYLKSIEIFCGSKFLSEKKALELIVKHSHENTISEVILHHFYHEQSVKLLPKELESYIIRWADYVPQRSLL
ncbi:hypothetical protein RclHR1_00950009 [Rhizophagus clarus]|uniref:F-box domain-containing protein n=1 Tax=Rhizophagus clarus TaxID=94130 RepID=A0A2Z6SIM4_9GLOM|nr:hypothetical protein RclHR1_00950009 [Rhizophagus clarus]